MALTKSSYFPDGVVILKFYFVIALLGKAQTSTMALHTLSIL